MNMEPEKFRENYNDDSSLLLLWAKERSNYVKKAEFTAVRVKDAQNFGLNSYGVYENGQFYEASWRSLLQLTPKTIEIGQNAQAFNEFVEGLQKDHVTGGKQYLNWLNCVQVVELSKSILENLIILLQNAGRLSVFEIFCVEETTSNQEQDEYFAKLLNILKQKDKLKAISFQYPMNIGQIHEWISALKFSMRLVRFNGTNGFQLSSLMKIREELPCVELLALQSFDRKLIDAETDNGPDGAEKIDIVKFFRRLGFIFCNLKMLFLDWNIVDFVCIYNEKTIEICKQIQDIYKKFKLQFLAILVYTPDEEMKLSAVKIRDYFQEANKEEDLRVRLQEFSVNPETPPNFTLIFFGEYHYQARTKRLVEIVVDQRVTKPDLRHFCYVVDGDNLLNPDITLEFAGLDKNAVLKRFNESREQELNAALSAEAIAQQFPDDSSYT